MCCQHIDPWSWMRVLFGISSTVDLCRFCVLSLHREVGSGRCIPLKAVVQPQPWYLTFLLNMELPGLVSRPGVIIHGCCCWEAAAGVSPLIAAAAAVAACCCNCNCICCCYNKNNNKIAVRWRRQLMTRQDIKGEKTILKWHDIDIEDEKTLWERVISRVLHYKPGAIGNQTIW